jgi:hypothetical protein
MHLSRDKEIDVNMTHIGSDRDFTPPLLLIIWTGFPTMHISVTLLFFDWGSRVTTFFSGDTAM